MAEYIEKTLITTELPFVMMKYGNYFNERQIEKIVEIVYELENSIEAADVQPVRFARWIDLDNRILCSGCGAGYDDYDEVKQNTYIFCPNCGARMDGDTNG